MGYLFKLNSLKCICCLEFTKHFWGINLHLKTEEEFCTWCARLQLNCLVSKGSLQPICCNILEQLYNQGFWHKCSDFTSGTHPWFKISSSLTISCQYPLIITLMKKEYKGKESHFLLEIIAAKNLGCILTALFNPSNLLLCITLGLPNHIQF